MPLSTHGVSKASRPMPAICQKKISLPAGAGSPFLFHCVVCKKKSLSFYGLFFHNAIAPLFKKRFCRNRCMGYNSSLRLAVLYGVSLDELVDFDIDIRVIQEVIDKTSGQVSDKIDWTKAWSKKYPILARYQGEMDTACYAAELKRLLSDLEKKYGYEELDAFLVLKDILASVWKEGKGNKKTAG